MKRLYIHSSTGGTGGIPFSGVNSDAIQSIVQVKDQSGFIVKDRFHRMIQEENQLSASLESIVTGMEMIDFIQEGSLQAALSTAGKSLLQYQWTNQGGVAANSIVTVIQEGIRTLK